MSRGVALLRGINVGGNHVIKMAALKASFERLGLKDVATFIQSGNVVFTAPKVNAALGERIGAALEDEYGFAVPTTVRDARAMAATVKEAPRGFGQSAEEFRYDVLFLFPELSTAEALARVPKAEGIDRVWAGPHALYYSRVVARATQSKLGKLSGSPIYPLVTVRNWNTTTKLLELVEA